MLFVKVILIMWETRGIVSYVGKNVVISDNWAVQTSA